jgi:fructuronate reductase/mannitol 2-dehydrogenase
MPSYLLPSIKEARAAGRERALLTLAVAGWFRYLTGEDYAGEAIDVQGPRKEQFLDVARRDGTDPRPLLTEREVFDGFEDDEKLVQELQAASEALRLGPREAIATRLAASTQSRE